jgi:hypothetical protein
MHRSRLSGFIIDCDRSGSSGLDESARFWGEALGMPVLGHDGDSYVRLDASARDLDVEVQAVSHPSRVHLDLETDDVAAEVRRLEALGAQRVDNVRTFVVMQAPSGQRFCVVRAKHDLTHAAGARTWP